MALTAKKTAAFSVITTLAFFLLLEAALALAGIKPILYAEDPFVGFASNIPLYVEDGDHLATAPNKIRWFNQQRFPKDKPDGAYRIFSLGGSTTYGRPYDDRASFSGWLRELLAEAAPDRQYEVINAGGISYASYRVATLMEELIDFEPDLFLIYTGHNEFLERRTYAGLEEAPRLLTGTAGLLSRTRIFTAGRKLLAASKPGAAMMKDEVDTILAHSVGPSSYTRNDEWRDDVIAHFRFNLERMIDIARSVDAEVILVTPAYNLKDSSPFKSDPSDSNRDAGLHYRRGREFYDQGRYEEAKRAFQAAVDEDICPLRAITPISQAVAGVAARRQIPLIDFQRIIEERSDHGITGAKYFLDHVHLTAEGYGILAKQILQTMLPGSVSDEIYSTVAERIDARIDRQAEGIALRNLAKVLDWAGKQEDASRLAGKAAEILGSDAESLNVLGRAAASRDELDAAIEYFQEALRVKPDFVEPHTPLGIVLGRKGRHDEAEHHFRLAIAGKPGFAEAHYNLGITLAQQGRADEAIASYRRALQLDPLNAAAHNNFGAALASQGQLDQALQHYRQALELRPDYAEARLNLGLALQAKGQKAEGIAHLQQALADNPNSPETLSNLGNALLARGHIEDAIARYNQALRIRPDLAETRYNLGNALKANGKLSAAEREYREALRLRPGYAEAHSNLASVLAARRRPAEAIVHYRRAADLQPNSAQARFNLAAAHSNLANNLLSENRVDEAIRNYRRALEAKPGFPEAHYNLGVALGSSGRVDDALHHFRRALELRPGYPEAHRYLATTLEIKGQFEDARHHLEEAIRLRPGWPVPLRQLAWMLATQKGADAAVAVPYAEKAASLTNRRDPVVLDTLAASYAAAGRFEEAVSAAEQAAQLYTNAAQRQSSLQRLALYRQRKPFTQSQ